MPQINTDDIKPNAAYDADEIAAVLKIHRTSVHKTVFKQVPTQTIGRRKTTMGSNLIRFIRGETNIAATN